MTTKKESYYTYPKALELYLELVVYDSALKLHFVQFTHNVMQLSLYTGYVTHVISRTRPSRVSRAYMYVENFEVTWG